MDGEDPFHGYDQTLPVLSRSPTAPWPTDAIPHTDPYGVPIQVPTVSPTDLPANSSIASASSTPAPAPATTPRAPKPPATARTTTGTERNAPAKVRKPRKAANTGGKSTLFWVNTGSQTAAAGTKEETLKRIRSHVMSEHNRKKRLENTKRYKGKTWKHLPFQPPEQIPGGVGPPRPPAPPSSASSSTSGSNESRRVSYVIEDSPGQELSPTTHTANYYYPVSEWDESGFDGVVGYQARPAAPPIWTYVGPGAHDPFNTGHTQLTDRMMRHLQTCQSTAL